ncbi:MAG: Serine/threonine-protein kinase StkP [Deltaproteobacteria bacterium ADurb.Bin207]|jgi:serine/threonine-protein kinase|nr:MAG: Serine/threonine-protein kinase StkP [Deltaproteobacteria bacterium ADurb.Bin207]
MLMSDSSSVPLVNPNPSDPSGVVETVLELEEEEVPLLEPEPSEEPTPAGSRLKSDPYIGSTFDGRYKVESILGEGGMGVVYRGRHKVIDKAVAIKVLRVDLARDAEVSERFLREARATSAIDNPHIIDISDFGTLPDGSTYFVMEYLDGKPLTSVFDDEGHPVPITRLIHIAKQIAVGLGAAHDRQIVHRDLKPDNVFLIRHGDEKDFVKILDFGIAKTASETAKLTRHGSVFGTPHYMSPEQAAGAAVDHRTDIYSLGVIMYEMASGRLPFDADNFMGILTQHLYQAPVPIRALVPPQDIPAGLEAIILKCLSKKLQLRYQSMQELIADIDKLSEGQAPGAIDEMTSRSGGFNVPADFFKSAMPVAVPATPAHLQKKRPWLLMAGIASLVVATAAVLGVVLLHDDKGAALSTPVVASDQLPVTPPSTSTTPSPIVSAAPTTRFIDVMIVSNAPNAEILLGDKRLGEAPNLVPVPEGQTVQVTVRAAGYASQTVELDGSEKRRNIVLRAQSLGRSAPKSTETTDRTPHRPPPASTPSPPNPKTPPTMGTGEIINPWAK